MEISNHPRIEMLAPASLKPRKRNPRTHNDKQITKIAASIRQFGFLVPVIVDDRFEIVAGHARVTAAISLGLDTIPVIRATFMSEADKRAFALAESRLAELGGWDTDALSAELNWLVDANYDLDVTGFDFSDIAFNFCGTPEEAEVLPPPSAKAVSRVGDLFHIGPHSILNGDSTRVESYELLLGASRASMVFSDLPYNLGIGGNVSGLGKIKHREFVQASGEMTQAEFTSFLRAVFRLLVLFSKRGTIHYHFMDWRHQREILDAADGVYTELKNLIVWKKSNAGMGTFYRSAHELIFAFKSGTEKHINNFGLGEAGRYRTNIWEYDGANSFRKGRKQDLEAHPTVKPLALVADAILDCSKPGDLILDPFSGSGTTLVAAHQTKRAAATIELDPLYVDTSIRRLCEASGLTAVHADGRPFAQVAADRIEEGKGA